MASVELRRAERTDQPEILELLVASLRWIPDEQHAAFFEWKHRCSPFGASPTWVAVDDGRIVGVRIFLRWEFVLDGMVTRAVRAVDTATHPQHQGRGIFTALTQHALDELRAEGVSFVFNTPNERSRPGYLKMGWTSLGRLPIYVRPRLSFRAARSLAGANEPADKWSVATDAGRPALDVLGGRSWRPANAIGLATARTPEFLAWRYGHEPLRYRAIEVGPDAVVFRLRRRGRATELAVVDVLTDGAEPTTGDGSAVARPLLRSAEADYLMRLSTGARPAGFVRVPRLGPELTWRALTDHQPPAPWDLGLGDVELF